MRTPDDFIVLIHETLKKYVTCGGECIRVTPAVVMVVAHVLAEIVGDSPDEVGFLARALYRLAEEPGALVERVGEDVAVETRRPDGSGATS